MGTAERVECLRDLSPAVYKTFELYGNKKRAVDLILICSLLGRQVK